jgi:hypothetical protein
MNLGERINIKKELPKTIQIHKRGGTFFTINALNKLIERDHGLDNGNVDYKNYEVDWENYQDSIILLKNESLEILGLKRKFID